MKKSLGVTFSVESQGHRMLPASPAAMVILHIRPAWSDREENKDEEMSEETASVSQRTARRWLDSHIRLQEAALRRALQDSVCLIMSAL